MTLGIRLATPALQVLSWLLAAVALILAFMEHSKEWIMAVVVLSVFFVYCYTRHVLYERQVIYKNPAVTALALAILVSVVYFRVWFSNQTNTQYPQVTIAWLLIAVLGSIVWWLIHDAKHFVPAKR